MNSFNGLASQREQAVVKNFHQYARNVAIKRAAHDRRQGVHVESYHNGGERHNSAPSSQRFQYIWANAISTLDSDDTAMAVISY